ncbi:MAG TPA: metallophosphoesterase, partial [Solirubrobacteraceae bacterium]|nr:metallophosphoesterase [Solirubrobacteraceae bacterium]
GRSRELRAGGAPRTRSYLRFRVPRLDGVVRRVVLRLLPASSSAHRLNVRSVATGRWDELAIAQRGAPAVGRVVGRSARPRAGRWLSVDVTPALRRSRRTVTLAVSGRGGGRARLYSRQAGRSRAPRLLISTAADERTPLDPVVAAAGDIACDPRSRFRGTSHSCRDRQTADVLADADLTTVLTLGDNQYEDGRLAAFRSVYDRSWGRFKHITRPAVGNHEYLTRDAAGYFDYFNGVGRRGGPAGHRDKGYYSFDVGAWHLIALNSACDQVGGCHAGSPQEQWLRADLAAHPARCTLAYWHHPRFSSGQQSSSSRFISFWRALYEAGADVVLAGHAHNYERFGPLTPEGVLDPVRGVRQFVVGTGGKYHYDLRTPEAHSEAADATTWGVLQLTLRPEAYEWRFVPEAGGTFTDAGEGVCH